MLHDCMSPAAAVQHAALPALQGWRRLMAEPQHCPCINEGPDRQHLTPAVSGVCRLRGSCMHGRSTPLEMVYQRSSLGVCRVHWRT
jgi:hypothetical protein